MTAEQSKLAEEWFAEVPNQVHMFSACNKVFGHPDDIESAMIEGMLRAIQNSETPSASYIKASMWNAARDYLRKETNRRRILKETYVKPGDKYDDEGLASVDLEDAVQSLPEDEQEVARQHLFEGKSVEEMSRPGRRETKTREVLNRGIDKLGKLYAE